MQVDKFTPRNARHGRPASEDERQMLVEVYGLPDHALADNLVLKQCGENAKPENHGKWFWTWGDAFFGFHGRMNKSANQTKFKNLKLKPFPNELTLDGQLGYEIYKYWTSKQNEQYALPTPPSRSSSTSKFQVNKYPAPKAAAQDEWMDDEDQMDTLNPGDALIQRRGPNA